MNKIVEDDLKKIHLQFGNSFNFGNSTILITGCAGFLGYYFMHYFYYYAKELGIKKIIGLDNFMIKKPTWMEKLSNKNHDLVDIHKFNIISGNLCEIKDAKKAKYILHMASIASPSFYRKFPIETLDANIWGLRKLLDFYCNKEIKGLLMFSSSEVYGDPPSEYIPTPESYLGNVSSIGPRACYDESKRFSETLCYLYSQKFNMPITMVRPFNNYGPGMSLSDKRVPSDFARAIVKGEDIQIFSDGSPTRTFCYISDAIVGYLKALTFGDFEIFNIGIDKPEISIKRLAEIFKEKGRNIFKYNGEIKLAKPPEKNYMTNNPNRRCPSLNLAKSLLSYHPNISIEEGIELFLKHLLFEIKK